MCMSPKSSRRSSGYPADAPASRRYLSQEATNLRRRDTCGDGQTSASPPLRPHPTPREYALRRPFPRLAARKGRAPPCGCRPPGESPRSLRQSRHGAQRADQRLASPREAQSRLRASTRPLVGRRSCPALHWPRGRCQRPLSCGTARRLCLLCSLSGRGEACVWLHVNGSKDASMTARSSYWCELRGHNVRTHPCIAQCPCQ